MTKTAVFLFLLLSIASAEFEKEDTPVGQISITDTLSVDIYQIRDSAGLPIKYKSTVVTPVCETDKCYIIQIIMYWDLIGRYAGYDTIPGQGLTKLDHVPFTEKDYQKLNEILSDRNSLLASYSKEDLTVGNRSSEIDGFTGATDQAIKESVISGGVYSCYALWHIANGAAVDSISAIAVKNLNREVANKLFSQHDQEINYFLIDHFSESDFIEYLPEVLNTISEGQGYFAKNAVEKMPEEVIADSLSLQFFATEFNNFDYFTQVALLKRLDSIELSNTMMRVLKENADDRSSYKNELIKSLIVK